MPGSLESFPGDVFTATPDHDALYVHAGVKAALAVILHGIRTRRGIVTLIGPSGTGKTTLLRHVADHLDDHTVSVFISNPPDTFDELVEIICGECGVPRGEDTRTAARLAALNEHLIHNLVEDQRVVIFIDEAQQLPELVLRQLRLLANLETSREKLLQVVLAGQPELLDMLRKPESERLRQRISGWARLEPLDRREALEYVTTRFLAAGLERRRYFRDVELRAIARAAGGIPRVINVICDNALVSALARSSMPVSTDDARRAIRRVTGQKALWLAVRGGAGELWGASRATRRMLRLDPPMRLAIRSRLPDPDARLGLWMAAGAVALVLAAAELQMADGGMIRRVWTHYVRDDAGAASARARGSTNAGTTAAVTAPALVDVAAMEPDRLVVTRKGAEDEAAGDDDAMGPPAPVGARQSDEQPAEPQATVVAAGIGLEALSRSTGPRVSERELERPASSEPSRAAPPASAGVAGPSGSRRDVSPTSADAPPPSPAPAASPAHTATAAAPAPASVDALRPPSLGRPAGVRTLSSATAERRRVEPYCGDGILALHEECDDGNENDSDRCLSNCMLNVCGDGILHVGVEECDDGDASNSDACLFGCALARCGDGYLHAGVEECDDGNDVDDDGCSTACRLHVRADAKGSSRR